MKVTETPGPSGYFGRHPVQTGRMARDQYKAQGEVIPGSMGNIPSARSVVEIK